MKIIWNDTKRILGMPISFTHYRLSEDRLFVKQGLLSTRENQTDLYRINDIAVNQTLWQKLFGVGDVVVWAQDVSSMNQALKNVKHPYDASEILYNAIKKAKDEKGVQYSEYSTALGKPPIRR